MASGICTALFEDGKPDVAERSVRDHGRGKGRGQPVACCSRRCRAWVACLARPCNMQQADPIGSRRDSVHLHDLAAGTIAGHPGSSRGFPVKVYLQKVLVKRGPVAGRRRRGAGSSACRETRMSERHGAGDHGGARGEGAERREWRQGSNGPAPSGGGETTGKSPIRGMRPPRVAALEGRIRPWSQEKAVRRAGLAGPGPPVAGRSRACGRRTRRARRWPGQPATG